MMETGIRAGEVIALHIDDLDLPGGRIIIRFGTQCGPVPRSARSYGAPSDLRFHIEFP